MYKQDLALNNLLGLICYKNPAKEPTIKLLLWPMQDTAGEAEMNS